MQLRGWRLTRASRAVIIVLVVQILGLGILLAAPPTAEGPGIEGPSRAAPAVAAVLPRAVAIDASLQGSVALERSASRPTPPAPVPLPHRLPRAPPAA